MDIRKLQRAIVDGLEDVKAQNIAVFNTEALSPLFERVIIATGASNRQTKALAASVRDAVKSRGMSVMSTEGDENGEWIIVDCGAAVAHIMQPAIREYYRLEEIWGVKKVALKRATVSTRLVKASEPEDAAPSPAAPRARTSRSTPAAPAKSTGRAPARKTAARTAASTGASPASKRAAPAKTARATTATKAPKAAKTASPARSRTPSAPATAPAKRAAPVRKTARKTA